MSRNTRLACFTAILVMFVLIQKNISTTSTEDASPPKANLHTVESNRSIASRQKEEISSQPDHSLDHDFSSLEMKLRRDRSNLRTETHPDGTVQVHLAGGFQSASIARRSADGGLEVICFNDFGQARDFLQQPQSANPPQIAESTPAPPIAER